MSETERLTVGAVLTVLLFLVPAFVLHTSPRFAGAWRGLRSELPPPPLWYRC